MRRTFRSFPVVGSPVVGTIVGLVLVGAVAGCSKSAPDDSHTATPEEQSSAMPTMTPSTASVPEPEATTDLAKNEIPANLQGRWGLTMVDCTGDPSIAKGLMDVAGKTLKFYESTATLKQVSSVAPYAVDGQFAFTGEGQNWNLKVALSSRDGGKTLVRKDTGADAMPGTLTYMRCP